jgi:hypothetical protein
MQLEYAQQIPPDLSIMMHGEPVVNADAGQVSLVICTIHHCSWYFKPPSGFIVVDVRGRWLDRFDRMKNIVLLFIVGGFRFCVCC